MLIKEKIHLTPVIFLLYALYPTFVPSFKNEIVLVTIISQKGDDSYGLLSRFAVYSLYAYCTTCDVMYRRR